MARTRTNYNRMYRDVEIGENNKIAAVDNEETKAVEEDSLPKVNIEGEKKTNNAGKVIGGLNLNVRKEPRADAEVIDTVGDGVTVTIMEEVNDDWYHIASPNGYVMKRFIQI